MKAFYLRFASEDHAIMALSMYRMDDAWLTASLGHALDVVGTISTGGQWDDEGNGIEAPTVLDGFHVNLMCEALDESLVSYAVTPTTPSRVFAGVA